jgi:choline dehydrogenase-like flavoprotein
MECYDAIVVGSGPGATFAAYGLRGKRVLVLDVGFNAPQGPKLEGNIYKLRRNSTDLFSPLIGESFESLHNLHQRPISLKLKSPSMNFVCRDWSSLSPVISNTFEGVVSLAKGGLANAWGAGVYRFTDEDLRGFPIAEEDLRAHYDTLTEHIGVSGANDDLAPYFGHDDALLPPLHLSGLFSDLLDRYERAHVRFEREEVWLGRPRLAVLTEERNGRSAYQYDNLEFFQAHNPAIYTPAYTIDEMRSSGAIEYLAQRLVVRFVECDGQVEVHARNLEENKDEVWCARKLCIGAGALNTARIVLESQSDYETRLPVLDNPMACIPFFSLGRIGAGLPIHDSSLAQLNLIAKDAETGDTLQGTLYGTTGPLRSDVLFSLPLSFRANLALLKYVMPAAGLLMLFYPGVESPESYVRLRKSGELEIEFGAAAARPAMERRIIKLLRKIGYLSHPSLIQRPGMGQGLHYAGTLPMRASPQGYQTDADGLLYGTRTVHIVDGSCFSRLPAKNLTFTIMANALRIGTRLARDL